ncbi:MAG: CDP-alcohol phosphatidyltransferase family protein [Candidatus Binataceae bacterium]
MLDTIFGRNTAVKQTQRRLAHLLFVVGATPNQVTLAGLACGIAAGVAFGLRATGWGIVLLLISAGLDAVDGTLAREFAVPTALGGILDLCADRLVESAVIIAIVWQRPALYLPSLLLVASWYINITVFLASGAALERGDKLITYAPGWVERGEAIVFFIVLALIPLIGPWLCYLYTALELLTAAQRLRFAHAALGS